MTLFELRQVVLESCAGLAALHSAGLVHRDIKPANLWLRLPLAGGERFDPDKHRDPAIAPPLATVVIDFGMVRAVRVPPEVGGRFVAGTAGYIAPEQVLDPVELDPAIGRLCPCGHRLQRDDRPRVLRRHREPSRPDHRAHAARPVRGRGPPARLSGGHREAPPRPRRRASRAIARHPSSSAGSSSPPCSRCRCRHGSQPWPSSARERPDRSSPSRMPVCAFGSGCFAESGNVPPSLWGRQSCRKAGAMTESENDRCARTRHRIGTALRRKYRPDSVRGLASVGLVTGALALASPEALAITKDQCVDANTKAQSLRREGKFAGGTRAAQALHRQPVSGHRPRRLHAAPRRARARAAHDRARRQERRGRRRRRSYTSRSTASGSPISSTDARSGWTPDSTCSGSRSQVTLRPSTASCSRRARRTGASASSSAGAAEPVPPGAGSAAEPREGSRSEWRPSCSGAAGLAGLAVGAVFGVLTIRDWSNSQSESECASPMQCPNHPAAVADHDRAETAGTISTVAFIAGGVLLATGLVAWLTSPSSGLEPAHASARLSPALGPGLAGVSVTGRF